MVNNTWKKHLTLLVIREMKIKTMLRFHLTQKRKKKCGGELSSRNQVATNAGEPTGKKDTRTPTFIPAQYIIAKS